jgi:hypothetical protein
VVYFQRQQIYFLNSRMYAPICKDTPAVSDLPQTLKEASPIRPLAFISIMASTSAEQQSSISRSDRSRTPAATYFHSPQPNRRHHTGRISRNRSTSALSLSDLNRQALWEAATGRSYRSTPPEKITETTSGLLPSVSEHLAPSSISSVPSLSSSGSPASSPPPFDIFSPPEPAVVSIEHSPAVLGHSIPEETLE